jgi:hypothetical protein
MHTGALNFKVECQYHLDAETKKMARTTWADPHGGMRGGGRAAISQSFTGSAHPTHVRDAGLNETRPGHDRWAVADAREEAGGEVGACVACCSQPSCVRALRAAHSPAATSQQTYH